MPSSFISPKSSGLNSLTGKLTASITGKLTRKLTGAELQQLFLEKFKLTFGSELITNGTFDDGITGWGNATGHFRYDSSSKRIEKFGGTGSENSAFSQAIPIVAGKVYRVEFDVTHTSGNTLSNVYINTGGGFITIGALVGSGHVSAEFTALTTQNMLFQLFGIGDHRGFWDNISVKEITKQAPLAAFSLRKLGDVSPYAARIRRSSDNTEAQVEFAGSVVSESSVVRNTSMNLLSFSEDFGQWTDYNAVTVTSGQADPFGGNNAHKISSPNASTYNAVLLNTAKSTSDLVHTLSFYQKKEAHPNHSGFSLFYSGVSNSIGYYVVDPLAGTCVLSSSSTAGVSSSINVESHNDDWWRISVTQRDTGANNNISVYMYPGFSSNGTTPAPQIGDVTIFGAMLEETVTYKSTGTEKLTDGGFDNGLTSWTAGGDSSLLSVENGAIRLNTQDGTYVDLHQFHAVTAGKKYEYRADLTFTDGGIAIGQDYNAAYTQTTHTSSGSILVTRVATATDSSSKFYIKRSGSPTNVLIDNLSVLEYDPIPSEYISTPVVSNDGLTFTESTLDTFVGGENLLSYSENFDMWTFDSNLSKSSGVADPFGGNNAYTLTNSGTNQKCLLNANLSAGQHTFSVYIRRRTGTGDIRLVNYIGTQVVTVTNEWTRVSRTDNYTGNTHFSIRVDTNGDEIDVFAAQLNTDSLKTYQKTTGTARDGNASVVVLYNQTGGEDIIQDTQARQPLLYSAGLLVKTNSVPSMQFDGSDDSLRFSDDDFSDTLNLNSLSSFVVFKSDLNDQTGWVLTLGTDNNTKRWYAPYLASGNFKFRYAGGSDHNSTDDTNVHLGAGVAGLNSGNFKSYLDGTELGSTTVVTNSSATHEAFIGTLQQGNGHFNGKISELVIFDTEQNINREAIESDIATAHNITLS